MRLGLTPRALTLSLLATSSSAWAADTFGGAPVPAIAPTAPTVGAQPEGYGQRAVGVRGGLSLPGAGDTSGTFGGAQAYERAVGVVGMGPLSARYFDEIAVGADGAGFAYAASGQAAIGPRLRLDHRHSLVLRPMVRASIRQEGGLYLSSLRVPGGEAGYQYLGPALQVDWVGHLAPLLTGVWQNSQWSVPLGGAAYGFSLSTTARPFRFDLDANWYSGSASQWAVLELRSQLCMLLGKKAQLPTYRTGDPRRPVHVGRGAVDYTWGLCADFANVRAENAAKADEFSSAWTVGISLLTGKFSLLDPAPGP